jgi:tRNA(fMet)-specific endonuclease VapC
MIIDSSILVAFERRRFDLERLLVAHPSPPAIAAITAAELLVGVERADSPERRARREQFVESVLARVTIIPFGLPQARVYAVQFAALARRGEVIGDRDLQIAATALSRADELATPNVREFERVNGLKMVEASRFVMP